MAHIKIQNEAHIQDSKDVFRPKKWKVIFLNDPFTTMDFVVHILETIYGYDENSAIEKMMEVHKKGRAIVGIYHFEIAETKRDQTLAMAEKEEFPLHVELEKVEE